MCGATAIYYVRLSMPIYPLTGQPESMKDVDTRGMKNAASVRLTALCCAHAAVRRVRRSPLHQQRVRDRPSGATNVDSFKPDLIPAEEAAKMDGQGALDRVDSDLTAQRSRSA